MTAKIIHYGVISVLILLLSACGGNKGNKEGQGSSNAKGGAENLVVGQDRNLNVSIFLDLSQRLQPSTENPDPKTRDIAAIKSVLQIFKADMRAKNAHRAKGRIKVFFNPIPNDPEINTLATDLTVDLGNMKPKEKKEVYNDIENKFEHALNRIYDKTLEDRRWVGADIWRFFKKDVKDDCILEGYRNVLIILTDGYIYHERSKQQAKNRYSYLLGPQIQSLGLRKNAGWKDLIDKGDIGLITTQQGLSNLEVLILEICPEDNHSEDEDILEYLLGKWLNEMGVEKYKIKSTDLPVNTKEYIERFFKQNINN